jgi:type I restriction enzyme M protein
LKSTRCFFTPTDKSPFFDEGIVTFEFSPNTVPGSHEKNSLSLVAQIQEARPGARVLEISTASNHLLGVQLSALNLKLRSAWGLNSVERTYQASKVFERGGPFLELLTDSRSAKGFPGIKSSGRLKGFQGPDGNFFPADGRSTFYDRLYIQALIQNPELLTSLLPFEIFTDVRFAKSKLGFHLSQPMNTQARSCAIAIGLFNSGGISRLEQFVDGTPMLTQPMVEIEPLFDL